MLHLHIVDAHCDTLSKGQEIIVNNCHLDFQRMRQAGVSVQFFAVFVSPAHRGQELERALEQIDLFYSEIEKTPYIEVGLDYLQIVKCLQFGLQIGILSVEGGEILKGSLSVLRMLYRLGVRSLTITWNNRNLLADGVGEKNSKGGLTDFGVAVVKEMNKLGMLIDVSHLSERGFWDVLELSTQPVIASHSNAREVCNHPRNLSNEQIIALASKGGVMGLTFVPDFVDPANPGIMRLLDHVDYVAALVGVDCLGLGSDFDGVNKTIDGLEDVSKLPALYYGLKNRGYCEKDVENILGGNFLRVMKHVLK